MKYSVVIATHNRAADLRGTLASLAGVRADGPWEVIIVDHNSSDDTRGVVEAAARAFPVELHYHFESCRSRSSALNRGITAARGTIIVTTGDDVRVTPGWLNAAARGLDTLDSDYVGGPVLPIWRGQRPSWLSSRSGRQWAAIALLDYGPKPKEFVARVPLGANMAFRRGALERVGLLDPTTGTAGTLLGQEVREWCLRARRAGVRGFYVPEMVVEHVISAERLTKAYFRRWFYWRGVSRATLYQRAGLDYGQALHSFVGWLSSTVRGRRVEAFEHETWLWCFAGVVKQRLKDFRVHNH